MYTYNLYFMFELREDALFSRTEAVYSHRKYPLHIKSHERRCVEALVSNLLPLCPHPESYDGFCFSYTIPQIGKEFDLLKITEKGVLNIELKSVDMGKKAIRDQLLKNRYYLGHLKKEISLFTYVMKQNLYYTLDEKGELVEVSIKEIAKALLSHTCPFETELDNLFEACDYLISPVGTPKVFLEGSYFLTQQQQQTKKKILKSLERKPSFIALSGEAGTGKTLLIYDLVRHLSKEHKCLLLHPGHLSEGHLYLANAISNFDIVSLLPRMDVPDFSSYDFIFADEAHRLPLHQFEHLKKEVTRLHNTCIFAYDRGQYLTREEQRAGIPQKIENLFNVNRYRLSGAIRSNKPLLQFEEALFDKKAFDFPISKKHIELYFVKTEHLEEASKHFFNGGYMLIDCRTCEKLPEAELVTAGAEYPKVALILNEDFYYTSNGKLAAKKGQFSLLPLRYLRSAISRAREDLALLVTDKNLFSEILELFEQ